MANPLTIDELGKRIAQCLLETVKEEIPDKPGQTDEMNDDQKALYCAIADAWGREMFYS